MSSRAEEKTMPPRLPPVWRSTRRRRDAAESSMAPMPLSRVRNRSKFRRLFRNGPLSGALVLYGSARDVAAGGCGRRLASCFGAFARSSGSSVTYTGLGSNTGEGAVM